MRIVVYIFWYFKYIKAVSIFETASFFAVNLVVLYSSNHIGANRLAVNS